MNRKGFPESYDVAALVQFLADLKSGQHQVRAPVYSHLVYDIIPGEYAVVDADEAHVTQWYVDRFLALRETAFQEPESFFRRFAAISDAEAVAVARSIWEEINGRNLVENILPTRERARLILEKAADHSVKRVRLRRL